MNQRITLVQTVADIETYQEMRKEKELPLVVVLTEQEITEYFNKKNKVDPFSIVSLYKNLDWWKDQKGKTYALLKDEKLKTLIEEKKIYIPVFKDLNGHKRYVDYIDINPVHNLSFGGQIIFRDKKRLFERMQAGYSIKRSNQDFSLPDKKTFPFFTSEKYREQERFEILCFKAIEQYTERQKRLENTKQKLKKIKTF